MRPEVRGEPLPLDLTTLVLTAGLMLTESIEIEHESESDIERGYAESLVDWLGAGDDAPAMVIRQYRLPSGRLPDIVAFFPNHVQTMAVVEVKKGRAKHEHVAQLRRYMRELADSFPCWRVLGQIVSAWADPDLRALNDDISFVSVSAR